VPAQPAQKADRSGKDWYSISVDTLRGGGLLLLLLILAGAGVFAYYRYSNRSTAEKAQALIAQSETMLQQLNGEKKATESFAAELAESQGELEEARTRLKASDARGALDSAEAARAKLQGILDAIALRGGAGQAQFAQLQGEVEFRRGDGGDWQEARSRVQLQSGDYVRTGDNGSADIMFQDGTLYTVRPNTQFIVAPASSGGVPEQTIQMEYGWVNLSTPKESSSNVKTPGAVARVKEASEAYVAVEKGSSQGRFGTIRGGMAVASNGGLTREVGELQQVVQTGDLLSEPRTMPAPPEPVEPEDNLLLDLDQTKRLVLAWNPVPGAARYALQVSRNNLFVDNVIDAENRTRTRATLGVRGEGAFQWRVAAFGANGVQGPWSTPRTFRVSPGGPAPGAAPGSAGAGKNSGAPPSLDLDDVKAYGSIFMVAGRSEPGARIEVNGEQVKPNADGSFTKPVQLTKEGWNIIEVRARDPWGNETVRRQRVFVEAP